MATCRPSVIEKPRIHTTNLGVRSSNLFGRAASEYAVDAKRRRFCDRSALVAASSDRPRRASFSLPILTCGTARANRDITDKSKERARGSGQISVLAIKQVDRNGCLEM